MSREKQNTPINTPTNTNLHQPCKSVQVEEMARDLHITSDCAEFLMNSLGYRKQEWISVDERLPEETEKELEIVQGKDKTTLTAKISEFVLVYSNHPERPYITMDRTVDGTWSNNWYITHWMPLPEAPKMKGGAV